MPEKNKILVVGSLAYDHVMTYDEYFRNVLVPDNYNIALTSDSRTVSYGGCSGNIAYSLRLLDENPIIMTVVGKDFDNYRGHLERIGVNIDHIHQLDYDLTASAFIITDKEENQITIFEPGAMKEMNKGEESLVSMKDINLDEVAFAIIAPENPKRMIVLAKEAKELGIPYIFDPAQVIVHIDPEDLISAIENADILILNKYEAELLSRHIGIPLEKIVGQVPTYIETHGPEGCSIKGPDGNFYVNAVKPDKVADPTGCGDAFRAGVLMGLRRGFPIQKACQIGALTATYSIEENGPQKHTFDLEEFSKRFKDSFGEAL